MKIYLISFIISILVHGFFLLEIKKNDPKNFSFEQQQGSISVKVIHRKITKTDKKLNKASENKATMSGVKDKPSPLVQISPSYPYKSRLLKEEGLVKVKVEVDTNGEVSDLSLLSSSGYPRLDSSVMDSLKSTKFSIARNFRNQAVRDSLELEFNFKMSKGVTQ